MGVYLQRQAIERHFENAPEFSKDAHAQAKHRMKKVKPWDEFKALWPELEHELDELRKDSENNRQLMPLEIIVPMDPTDEESSIFFREHLLKICAARNNNIQLQQATKANQEGLLDFIREALAADARTCPLSTKSSGRPTIPASFRHGT